MPSGAAHDRGCPSPVEQQRPLPRRRPPRRRTRGGGQLGQADLAGRDEPEPPVAAVAPDEAGHEVVRGVGEQLARWRELRQHAAHPHHGDLVAEADGLVDVVGDEQDRLAQVALQAQQLVLQVDAHDGVDRGERLVHQQHRGVAGQRAGHADALLLPAGELRGVALRERRVEADALEHLGGPRPRLTPRQALQHGHGGDVVDHAAVREEPGVLDDVADAAAQQRRVGRRRRRRRRAAPGPTSARPCG